MHRSCGGLAIALWMYFCLRSSLRLRCLAKHRILCKLISTLSWWRLHHRRRCITGPHNSSCANKVAVIDLADPSLQSPMNLLVRHDDSAWAGENGYWIKYVHQVRSRWSLRCNAFQTQGNPRLCWMAWSTFHSAKMPLALSM